MRALTFARTGVGLLGLGLASCNDPKVEQAKSEVASIAASITRDTKGDEGSMRCPTFEELVHNPAMPRRDPWGHPYAIACGNGHQVFSVGPDGVPGTKDDIYSAGRRGPFPP
jgi:hypothetical protein